MCKLGSLLAALIFFTCSHGFADENLLGYVRGVETMPANSWEVYQIVTSRDGKGKGSYHAWNTQAEVEYGVTDRFTVMAEADMQAINTNGLVIDAYMPKDERYGLTPSGVEFALKYNFLRPAIDPLGLSTYLSFNHAWLDPHSGQDKDIRSVEMEFLFQKYFLDAQLIWVLNVGMESTWAKRGKIDDLPAGFEWPTQPEMEIEVKYGTGLSYRFISNWFIGGEWLYEAEYETTIDRERFSIFAGPSLHYARQNWWATLTWMPQLQGGGQSYPDQPDRSLQLVEKTEQETRLKVGFVF